MLRLFRINDPYRLVLIFLILILIRAVWIIYGLPLSMPTLKWMVLGERLAEGYTMYSETFDYSGPLAAFVYKWAAFLFGSSVWVHFVLSTLLVTIQAAIFNSILLRNKAFDENSYVPAFLYVILMSGTMDFFALSPQLMSMTFIVLSLNNIFRRIDNQVTDELFLSSGIYLGLATFFYFPAIVYFITFLLSFIIFSSAVPRRLLLLVYGSVMVLIIIWCYFFWFGSAWDFLHSFFVVGLTRPKVFYMSYPDLLKLGAVLIFVFLISVSVLFTARFTNFQQKMQQVMFFFLFAALASVALSRELSGAVLTMFVPCFAFFLTHYLLQLRRKLFRAIIPDLFILCIVLYPVYWMQSDVPEKLVVADTQNPFSGKRIMVIGDSLSLYRGNEVASPFIDPYLSRQKLEDLEYYRQASRIYDLMRSSDAEVIVDEWQVMPKLMQLFPVLDRTYQRQAGSNIYRKVSS